ncbi:MAG: PqqD family protein [Lachnospiraceae bacterium]|nr:PqqD family protein [Lachnospiraceae bacterium]
MKLKSGFITHESGGEHYAVASGEAGKVLNGMIRNNDTADFIFRQLLQETTEEEIVDAMLREYDAPKERITGDVHKLIGQIREEGFLDE